MLNSLQGWLSVIQITVFSFRCPRENIVSSSIKDNFCLWNLSLFVGSSSTMIGASCINVSFCQNQTRWSFLPRQKNLFFSHLNAFFVCKQSGREAICESNCAFSKASISLHLLPLVCLSSHYFQLSYRKMRL